MPQDRRRGGQDHVTESLIPGGWSDREIRLADRIFRLVLPADPDEFLEHLDTHDSPPTEWADPFWARLWPCATPMAEWMLQTDWSAGQRALELGCGVGLVGLAALAKGLQVTFSDRIDLAVTLALENARRNGFPQCRGSAWDWRHPPAGQFPMIFGSDLLYDPQGHQPLLQALDRMLLPDAACWIGDPGRYHVAHFVDRAHRNGFAVELRDLHQTATQQDWQLLIVRRE